MADQNESPTQPREASPEQSGGASATPPQEPPPQGARYVDANVDRAAQGETPPQAPEEPPEAPEDPPADDSAVGAGGNKLEGDALKLRLEKERERERRRTLKEMFGTDDPKEVERIKAERDEQQREFARLRRVEEARKRARMTTEQRVQKSIEEKDAEITRLQEELKNERQGSIVKEQNALVGSVMSQHIDEGSTDFVTYKLREHVKSLQEDPKKLAQFSGNGKPEKLKQNIERWVQDFVKAHPQHGVSTPSTEPEAPPAPQPRVRRPVHTGSSVKARQPAPRPSAGQHAGKTIKPGPNQMTSKELDDYYREKGMRKPY